VRKGGESKELSLLGRKQSREAVDAKREEDAMSLVKRNIGRRVAGVGVAVALMVLGLQTPAFAAVTISALSPTSGPPGCIVVATGTGFRDFPAATDTDMEDSSTGTTVQFVTSSTQPVDEAITATNFFAFSGGETMWVEAPDGLDAGTSYFLRVDNPSTADLGITSTASFLATTGAGGCAPTITSFTPTCTTAGNTVTITGTNLQDADMDGAAVFFAPYETDAAPVVPDVSDVTSLTVVVPSGTTDGQIKIVNEVTDPTNYDANDPVGTDTGLFSTTSFLVPPPDCVPDTGNEHARNITFKINKKGRASGVVSSTEDPAFTDCVAAVPVKIQRKKAGGGWKTVGKTTTDDTGAYVKKVKNKKGKQKFRALAPKVSLGDPVTDVCLKAKSATRSA
jgi:IPT/TIG domain